MFQVVKKHVEQFPDKINCVMSHLIGYILEYRSVYLYSIHMSCIRKICGRFG